MLVVEKRWRRERLRRHRRRRTAVALRPRPDDAGRSLSGGCRPRRLLAGDADAVDAAFERVAQREDCAVVAEPRVVDPADTYAAFVADPDDYTVELVAPA